LIFLCFSKTFTDKKWMSLYMARIAKKGQATQNPSTTVSEASSTQIAVQPVLAAPATVSTENAKQNKRRKSSMLPISEVSIEETSRTDAGTSLAPTPSVLENEISAPASSERRQSSMRRRSSLHPVLSQAILEDEEAAPAPASVVADAVAFAAPSSSERRQSSMRRRSSLHPVLEARTTMPSEDEVELMSDNIEPLAIQDSKRRKSSMRRRSSVHPIMETHAIQEEPDTDPVPVFISAAVDSDVVEPAPSERRKSSMRRRSSFHPSVTSVISENPPNLDSHSMSSSAADLPVSCVSETTADCAQNESSDDMEMTGVLPVMLVSAAPAQFAVASDAAVAFAALKSPGKRVSSQKIESLVSVFEQKSQSTSVSKISALKSPPPFRGLRAEEPPAPSAAQAVSHAGPAVTATAPLTKPVVVEDKASLVRNLIKRIESNHQSIAGTPSYKGGPSSDVSTPVIQLTSASTPHSAVPCPASAAVLPSETDHSFGPFATTLTLPLPMAALATPTATTILAPAVACALDQSADTSIVQLALDCSLNASMDCSFNGSFSEARQSKPKPVIVATQADKARRDAEKKAAEVESASALRLDSEAKHKAARERRLQLEE
jgi:hypothetical protein